MRRVISLRTVLCAAAATGALAAAAPAQGNVYVDGTGEPAFTNSTTNTQWVRWEGSSAYATYKLELEHYEGATMVSSQSGSNVDPKGSGAFWVNWGGVRNLLVEGTKYGICVYGRYTVDGAIGARDTGSCSDASGKRAFTTIDRTKPAIAVKIDDGAAWSRTGSLDYRIDYSDNLAFPFPANFICRDIGTDPAQACKTAAHLFDDACSVPVGGMQKTTYFTCEEQLPASAPDGPVTLCVRSADAAVPDNPSSANQSGNASQANLSDQGCDSIVVDRTPPSLSFTASAETVLAGDPVSFAAQASDATSGLSGSFTWDWRDGTPGGSGASAFHTSPRPRTCRAR